MNTIVTSREELLQTAKEIVKKETLSGLSIRKLASICNISVGSIYNYFPTKGELILAVIEDFWKEAFHGITLDDLKQENFLSFFHVLYQRLKKYFNTFETSLLEQISFLNIHDRQKGKEIEKICFLHIKNKMLSILEEDKKVKKELWTSDFTKKNFIDFVFQNMLFLLKEKQENIHVFEKILEKVLYI